MLKAVLVLALSVGPVTPMAIAEELKHELDSERVTVVPLEQKRLAAHLPQTLIIREDTRDPSKLEVAHVKDHVPAGKKAENATFEKMALNSEVRGLPYDTGNELDMTSSTNSWGFGLALGLGALGLGVGLAAGRAWAAPSYGYGYYPESYYAPRSYYSGYYAPSYTYANYYRPYYSYAGYRYAYAPYYRYTSGYYNYTYCNWPASYYY